MGIIGASKKGNVGTRSQQLLCLGKIVDRDKAIRVKEYEPVRFVSYSFRPRIPCGGWACILLVNIAKWKLMGVLLYKLFAPCGGTVIHHHHLEIAHRLVCQRLKKLCQLLGTVVNGNNDGE